MNLKECFKTKTSNSFPSADKVSPTLSIKNYFRQISMIPKDVKEYLFIYFEFFKIIE